MFLLQGPVDIRTFLVRGGYDQVVGIQISTITEQMESLYGEGDVETIQKRIVQLKEIPALVPLAEFFEKTLFNKDKDFITIGDMIEFLETLSVVMGFS